jgi:hypothetical protein
MVIIPDNESTICFCRFSVISPGDGPLAEILFDLVGGVADLMVDDRLGSQHPLRAAEILEHFGIVAERLMVVSGGGAEDLQPEFAVVVVAFRFGVVTEVSLDRRQRAVRVADFAFEQAGDVGGGVAVDVQAAPRAGILAVEETREMVFGSACPFGVEPFGLQIAEDVGWCHSRVLPLPSGQNGSSAPAEDAYDMPAIASADGITSDTKLRFLC